MNKFRLGKELRYNYLFREWFYRTGECDIAIRGPHFYTDQWEAKAEFLGINITSNWVDIENRAKQIF